MLNSSRKVVYVASASNYFTCNSGYIDRPTNLVNMQAFVPSLISRFLAQTRFCLNPTTVHCHTKTMACDRHQSQRLCGVVVHQSSQRVELDLAPSRIGRQLIDLRVIVIVAQTRVQSSLDMHKIDCSA